MKKLLLAVAVTAAASAHAHDFGFGHDHDDHHHPQRQDFGQQVQKLARAESLALFGVIKPLAASSAVQTSAADADADPTRLITVAKGLKVRVVSAAADLGPNIDQMVLWPNDKHPTHIIACNEQGSGQVGVQRIDIKTGAAANIIASGLSSCDPARLTPWGTILVGEEAGTNGRVFEILNPLTTTDVVVSGAGSGTAIAGADAANVAFRGALGQLSFEGLAVLPNGVVYMSDENRPGKGNAGGGIFKFIPSTLWNAGSPAITDLAQSPFSAGTLWGYRTGRNSGNTDFGLGNTTGRGVWVAVPTSTSDAPTNLRAQGTELKLSAYYRPEDMDLDAAALARGEVRFCGTVTGQDVPDTEANGDNHWGEVYCMTDGTVADAGSIVTAAQSVSGVTYTLNTASVPEYQPLVIGDRDFAMMDNIAYQPGRGNWVVNEDGEGPTYDVPRNNDIFACTDDGDDDDHLADACVKVMSLNDLTAESTGGVFDGYGKRYFVSVQHNITGHGVILEVTGWK